MRESLAFLCWTHPHSPCISQWHDLHYHYVQYVLQKMCISLYLRVQMWDDDGDRKPGTHRSSGSPKKEPNPASATTCTCDSLSKFLSVKHSSVRYLPCNNYCCCSLHTRPAVGLIVSISPESSNVSTSMVAPSRPLYSPICSTNYSMASLPAKWLSNKVAPHIPISGVDCSHCYPLVILRDKQESLLFSCSSADSCQSLVAIG